MAPSFSPRAGLPHYHPEWISPCLMLSVPQNRLFPCYGPFLSPRSGFLPGYGPLLAPRSRFYTAYIPTASFSFPRECFYISARSLFFYFFFPCVSFYRFSLYFPHFLISLPFSCSLFSSDLLLPHSLTPSLSLPLSNIHSHSSATLILTFSHSCALTFTYLLTFSFSY